MTKKSDATPNVNAFRYQGGRDTYWIGSTTRVTPQTVLDEVRLAQCFESVDLALSKIKERQNQQQQEEASQQD